MSLFEAISLKGPIVDHIADNYPDDILLFQMHFAIKGRSFRSEPATLREARSVILDTPFVIPADAVAQSTEDPQVLIFITCYSQAQRRQGRNSFGMNVNEQILLAEASLDLATLRLYQGSFLSVDLIPCLHDFINTGGDASAGAIFLRVGEFQPLQSDSEAEALRLLVAQKQSLRAARSRQLFHLVKSFWARVQAEHVHVSNRQLKFIAEDECGRLRFVGSFISAMACQRQIEGPRFAARFVSLIPYRREMTLAGGRVNRWQSAFGTLSSLRGDVEDHCVLLCSLLLGWGFNAYVAQGTIHVDTHSNTNANGGGNSNIGGGGRDGSVQPHCWVVTLDGPGQVTYWESLTGEQIAFNHGHGAGVGAATGGASTTGDVSLRDSHFYELFALFRNDEYLVNVQSQSVCTLISYDVKDMRQWQRLAVPMEIAELASHVGSKVVLEDYQNHHQLTAPGQGYGLRGIEPSIYSIEERIEAGIKEWLVRERQGKGLTTHFDDAISRIVQPTLLAYELDRAQGGGGCAAVLLKDFQTCVRRVAGRGESLKAYPTCFNHCDLNRILSTLSKSKAALEVAFCLSSKLTPSTSTSTSATAQLTSQARFGLRVKLCVYPRGVCALWVALASCGAASDLE